MIRGLTYFEGMDLAEYFHDVTKPLNRLEVVCAQSYEQFKALSQDGYDWVAVHCRMFSAIYPWDWMTELAAMHPHAQVMVALCSQTYDSLYNDIITRLAEDFNFTLIPLGLTEREAALKIAEQLTKKPLMTEKPPTMGMLPMMEALPTMRTLPAMGTLPTMGTSLTMELRTVPQGMGELSAHAKQGALISVMSASPKDGATTVAVNLALQLALATQLNIGLLDLNLKSPEIGDNFNFPSSGRNVFSLLPKLHSSVLNSTEMIAYCSTYPKLSHLHILPGSHRRDTAGDVTMTQIKQLLDTAKHTFDIVIADVHTFPDNAATIYAVKHADQRLLVAQPNYNSFKLSWMDWYESFWRHCGLKKGDFSLIANRIADHSKVRTSQMATDTGAKLLATIPKFSDESAAMAVNDGLPLLLGNREPRFTQEIAAISRKILMSLGIESTKPHPGSNANHGLISRMMAAMMPN